MALAALDAVTNAYSPGYDLDYSGNGDYSCLSVFISIALIVTLSITSSGSKPAQRRPTVKQRAAPAVRRYLCARGKSCSSISYCGNGPDLIRALAKGSAPTPAKDIRFREVRVATNIAELPVG